MSAIYNAAKDKLNRLKIGQKMSFIIALAVVSPILLLSIFFSRTFYDATLTKTIQEKQTEISQIEPRINREISRMMTTLHKVRSQPFFLSVFTEPETELTPSLLSSETGQSFFDSVREITEKQATKTIKIYVDLPKDHPVFKAAGKSDTLMPLAMVRGSYWHGIFTGTHCKELFCPSFYLSIRERTAFGDLAYIAPIYCTVDGRRVPSFICLYYSSDIIKNILTEFSKEDGTVSYVITDRDAIVTSTNEVLSGIYHFSYEDIYEYLFSSNNYMEKEILGQTVYLSFKGIQRPNWFLIDVVPDSVIREATIRSILRYLLVTVAILAASMLITTRISSSLANRISSVITTMSDIRKGSLKPMEEPEIKDEIGDLISTYNYMTDQQKTLTENLKKTADELRIAEVNALQAQINPHFLYNTLDTIQWMAMTGKEDEVSDTVQKLSRFYRLTLGKDMTNTTIEKEIEHASIYVDLQNIRFDDAIDFIVDIPEELASLPIPRLTLQPIVENAILHGIREKESQEGCIVITGWEEENEICLLVSDDGVGIEKNFLPKILSEEGMNPSTKGTNIAIYNVHHRLQLLYGENYGLSYESRIGEGTEVMIRLPGPARDSSLIDSQGRTVNEPSPY